MHCGKPIASEQEEYCTDCKEHRFHYERGFAVFVYDERMQRAVADFKYSNRRELGDFFADELSKLFWRSLRELHIQALIPVPIHRKRRRYRGYNQAEVLCEKLSKIIGLPTYTDLLLRDKETAPQKELDARSRLQNIEAAIRMNPEYRENRRMPRVVALVDDIYTTGSTAEACTRALLGGGVETVYVLSLCIGTER